MRHAWATVAVVALASFQIAMTLSVVFVVFVDLDDYFPDASNAQLSWAINSFTIVIASTVMLGSAIADRWGRRRIALGGTALFALGSLVAGTAPTVAVLIVGRCIQALGAALSGPASFALILDAVPFQKRGIALGVFTMGGALAAASGPAVGGIIVENLGWRWAFLAIVPFGLVSFVVGYFVYKESYGIRDQRLPDPIGSLILMTGVGAVILALVQIDEWGWGDRRTVVSALVGITLIAVLLRRSSRHPRPIVDLSMYRYRSFRAGNAGIATFAASFFTMQFAAIFFLTEVWGYEIDRAGLLASPFFLATGLTAPIAGRAVDRIGPRPVVCVGASVWALAILVLWFVVGSQPHVVGWLTIIVAGGLGSGLVWGAAPTLAVEDLETSRFARATGMNQTCQNTGNALAIAIAITLLGDDPVVGDFGPVFALVVLMGVLTTAIAWTAGPRPDGASADPKTIDGVIAPTPI